MWSRCCSRVLARLACAAALATVLVLQVVEPPLVSAIPATPPAPSPATRGIGLQPFFAGGEQDPLLRAWLRSQLARQLPVLLAQAATGYDAGSSTAGGLLNAYRLPTDQHLQSVPNYDPAELERQKGNQYYRQAPSRPDSPDPLRDEVAASTDPTLQLVQERATRPPWSIDLKSINAMQGGQVDIPENGCGLFEYCVTEGAVDRTEECTVHYAYEEATCHEYYSHDTECQTVTSNGNGALASDNTLFVRIVLESDGTYTLAGLDTGEIWLHHKNVGDGPPGPCATWTWVDDGSDEGGYWTQTVDQACLDAHYVSDWHVLAHLPASSSPPTIAIHTAGDGCVPMDSTLTLPPYTRDSFPSAVQSTDQVVGNCPANGAQWQTYAYVSTASDCHPVPHFHDECTAYEAAPWFEKSHQCLTPAPGFNNDCDDLFRTYGKYTEISSTCLPWIEMGCGQTGETCTTDDCTTATRTYSCREQGCVQYQQAVLCSTCVPDPPNAPRCITTDTPANTAFGMATAMMEGQVTSEQNRDNTGIEIYAFPGFAQSCKSNPLINCCNQGSAQETANNIQKGIQAMQIAMNVYKAYQTLSTFYTATTTMMEVYGYAMTEAAELVASEMMSSYFAAMFAFSWAGVFMVVIVAIAMLIQMLMSCDEASTETAVKKNMDLCVDVGEYCSQKLLVGCWGKKHAYCCFTNLIARIIQEQGRAQLGIGWGDPKAPDCRGLTVEELQAIDWERIDFGEYIDQLQSRITVPTAESVTTRGAQLTGSTDFLGQAHATLDRYAGLEARVAQDLTVPGTDPPTSVPASARMTLGINGQGSIALSPGSYGCGRGTCPIQLPANHAFAAAATPADGWGFSGWSGACSGAGACMFTLTHDNWLNALFIQTSLAFHIRIVGPGTVTMSPSRPACTGDCAPNFPPGTVVTLTAAPLSGAIFLGWGGECSGTGPCTVTVRSTSGVTADFAYQPEITTFSPSAPGTLKVGVPMTWTVGVTGGAPPVEYEFTRNDNGTAVVVQAFSASPIYTWIPTAANLGSHRIQVAVRNAGGSTAGDDFAITESFTVAP